MRERERDRQRETEREREINKEKKERRARERERERESAPSHAMLVVHCVTHSIGGFLMCSTTNSNYAHRFYQLPPGGRFVN